jgi:hypothetical protein
MYHIGHYPRIWPEMPPQGIGIPLGMVTLIRSEMLPDGHLDPKF